MAATLPPGIGSPEQINQANIFMREQPWYQQLLQSWGQNPNSVNLSDNQQQQVLTAARNHGIGISDRFEIDPSGNIREQGHKLRDVLLAGGLAAGALTGGAALGLFGGAAEGAGAAGAAGAGAAEGAGAAGAAGTAAGLGGVEAGAEAGLSPFVASGALGSGAAGAAGAAGADAGAFDAAGNFVGPSTVTGIGSNPASSSDFWQTLGDVGGALGSAGVGRAQGRLAETQANAAYDRALTDLYASENTANTAKNNFGLNRAGVDLAQRNFALTAPGARAHNAVRGDILSSAKDVAFSGLPAGINVPTISGGLRPSMFTPQTRSLGSTMTQQALDAQQKGDTFDPLPQWSAGPNPPTLPPPPQASSLDTLLNSAGTVGSLSSILARSPQILKLFG